MKTTIQLLALTILAFAFSSCCGSRPCGGAPAAQKEVTTYKEVQRTVYANKTSYVVTERIPVTTAATKTKRAKSCCNKCGSSFCPKPQRCGIISNAVLARASAQGGTGEPNIGLVPTMKNLTPDNL